MAFWAFSRNTGLKSHGSTKSDGCAKGEGEKKWCNSTKELVPGDILEFEAGNVIPADLQILESFNLKIQEAALTDECEPVDKGADPVNKDDVPLGDVCPFIQKRPVNCKLMNY